MPHHRLARYGPLVLWAALIFIGSTDLLSAANTGGVLVRPVLWLFPHASERTVAIYQFASVKRVTSLNTLSLGCSARGRFGLHRASCCATLGSGLRSCCRCLTPLLIT